MSEAQHKSDDDVVKNAAQVPSFCDWHHHDLIVRQLRIPESGPWRSTTIVAQLLLFSAVVADPAIGAMLDGSQKSLRLVVGGMRCLACTKPDAYARAIRVLKKGFSHAAQVQQGKATDPDWPAEWQPLPPEGP